MPTATFTPSEKDLIEANRLWFRSSLKSRGNVAFVVCGALICAAVAFHTVSDRMPTEIAMAVAAGVIFWSVVIALLVFGYPLMVPRQVRKQFKMQKSLHETVTLTWSDDEIRFETENSHSRHGWGDFPKWAEGRAIFLLYFTDNMFIFIPKAALAAGDADDLRSRLELASTDS